MGGPEQKTTCVFKLWSFFLITSESKDEISFVLFCTEDAIYVSIIYHSMYSLSVESEEAYLRNC